MQAVGVSEQNANTAATYIDGGISIALSAGTGAISNTSKAKVVAGSGKTEVVKETAEGFTVNPSKFDYFFGKVVSGSEHNIARSAQNLKDLTTLGIKNEGQLTNVFNQAFESGTVVSSKTTQYGATVMKSVDVGSKGSINVGFFLSRGKYERNSIGFNNNSKNLLIK